jgi:transposase-like protein
MFKTPEDRLSEIELYELVAEEIENNQQSKGLWVKALSDSEGDLDKGQALYVKLRVQMIKDEWAHLDKVRIEQEKARQAEAEQKTLSLIAAKKKSDRAKSQAYEKKLYEEVKPKQEAKAKFAARVSFLFFVFAVLAGVGSGWFELHEYDGILAAVLYVSLLLSFVMWLRSNYHRHSKKPWPPHSGQ